MPIFKAKHLKTITTGTTYSTSNLWCDLVNDPFFTEIVSVNLYSLINLLTQAFLHSLIQALIQQMF